MKNCSYCGKEYSDEMEVCPTDGKSLQRAGQVETPMPGTLKIERHEMVSPEEQRFWRRMTFRQFAILMVRLQAVWLLFYAAVDATYLSRYFNLWTTASSYAALSPAGRLDLLMLILRVIMHVAAAVALIQHAEKVLSWLVKDSIPKEPPRANEQDIAG